MELTFAATPANAEDQAIISISLEEGEALSVGDEIGVEMTDETLTFRKVLSIRKWSLPKNAARGKWVSVKRFEGKGSCEVTVDRIHSSGIQTTSMPSHEERRRWEKMICLTPYKEIHGGELSIYDNVEEGYTVPDKVIAYLRTSKPFVMSPGIYPHPFKDGESLTGPYYYTDDKFYWDRDTWKYVVKYGLKLDQEFIYHVMSNEGTRFLEQYLESSEAWPEIIKRWKKREDFTCLLPDNGGDQELDDF